MKPLELKLPDYNAMVQLYHSESDRGAAVLAGSYVENVLGAFLIHKMTDKTLAEDLFGSDGPLSTFSQRIKVAQAFGFIKQDTGKVLQLIRKIRNHFAHHPQDASFEKAPVSDWADALGPLLPLRTEQKDLPMSRRDFYLISCGVFAGSTHVRMGN